MPHLVRLKPSDREIKTLDNDFLLLHGFASDNQSWVATAPALFEFGRVWVIDLPGHGKSPVNDCDGTIHSLCEQVVVALDDAKVQSTHVIGHSLGGHVAMHLASQESVRIQSLVLISPAGLGGSINENYLHALTAAVDETTLSSLLQRLVADRKMIVPGLASQLLATLNRQGQRDFFNRVIQSLVESSQHIDATVSALVDACNPCKLIWGLHDNINTIDEPAMSRLSHNISILENCGHLPHLEQRLVVNQLLNEFYRSIFAELEK